MSELKDKLHLKQNSELVAIVESKDAYTFEAIQFAAEVLQERFIETEELEQLAKQYWGDELQKSLKTYLKVGVAPISNFLSEEDLKTIFAQKFEEYVERKELLSVDSTIYWFAF